MDKNLEDMPEIKLSLGHRIISKIFRIGSIKLKEYIMDESIPIEEPERFLRKLKEYHKKYAHEEIEDFAVLSGKGAIHVSGNINRTVEITDRRPHYSFYFKPKNKTRSR